MRWMEHKAHMWKMSAVNLGEEPTQEIRSMWKDNMKVYLRDTGPCMWYGHHYQRVTEACTPVLQLHTAITQRQDRFGRRTVQSQTVNRRKEHWTDTKRFRGTKTDQSERHIFGSKTLIQSVITRGCSRSRKWTVQNWEASERIERNSIPK
jgi:hypothetical protein